MLQYQEKTVARHEMRKSRRIALILRTLMVTGIVSLFALPIAAYFYVDHVYNSSWNLGDSRQKIESRLLLFRRKTLPNATCPLLGEYVVVPTDVIVEYELIGTGTKFQIVYDATGSAVCGWPDYE